MIDKYQEFHHLQSLVSIQTLCPVFILNSSDVFELDIGELSRAEPSWIFPSRAELVGFWN